MWFEIGVGYIYFDVIGSSIIGSLLNWVIGFWFSSLAVTLIARIIKLIPFV